MLYGELQLLPLKLLSCVKEKSAQPRQVVFLHIIEETFLAGNNTVLAIGTLQHSKPYQPKANMHKNHMTV